MLDNKVLLFLAVAEHGSMRSAAKSLYMTQPALSQQMTQLERETGVVLLRRGPKGVELTPAGELFYNGVRQMQSQLDELMQRVREASMQSEGVLRLAGGKNQRQLCLLDVCREFAQRYPNVRQSFITLPARDIPRAVATGEVDVSECWAAPMLREAGCRWQRGRTFEAGLVVPLSSPLASKGAIGLEDLDGQKVVVNAYGHFDCTDSIRDEVRMGAHHIDLVDASDDEAMENYALNGMLAITPYPYSYSNVFVTVVPFAIKSKIVSGFAYSGEPSVEARLFIDLVGELYGQ